MTIRLTRVKFTIDLYIVSESTLLKRIDIYCANGLQNYAEPVINYIEMAHSETCNRYHLVIEQICGRQECLDLYCFRCFIDHKQKYSLSGQIHDTSVRFSSLSVQLFLKWNKYLIPKFEDMLNVLKYKGSYKYIFDIISDDTLILSRKFVIQELNSICSEALSNHRNSVTQNINYIKSLSCLKQSQNREFLKNIFFLCIQDAGNNLKAVPQDIEAIIHARLGNGSSIKGLRVAFTQQHLREMENMRQQLLTESPGIINNHAIFNSTIKSTHQKSVAIISVDGINTNKELLQQSKPHDAMSKSMDVKGFDQNIGHSFFTSKSQTEDQINKDSHFKSQTFRQIQAYSKRETKSNNLQENSLNNLGQPKRELQGTIEQFEQNVNNNVQTASRNSTRHTSFMDQRSEQSKSNLILLPPTFDLNISCYPAIIKPQVLEDKPEGQEKTQNHQKKALEKSKSHNTELNCDLQQKEVELQHIRPKHVLSHQLIATRDKSQKNLGLNDCTEASVSISHTYMRRDTPTSSDEQGSSRFFQANSNTHLNLLPSKRTVLEKTQNIELKLRKQIQKLKFSEQTILGQRSALSAQIQLLNQKLRHKDDQIDRQIRRTEERYETEIQGLQWKHETQMTKKQKENYQQRERYEKYILQQQAAQSDLRAVYERDKKQRLYEVQQIRGQYELRLQEQITVISMLSLKAQKLQMELQEAQGNISAIKSNEQAILENYLKSLKELDKITNKLRQKQKAYQILQQISETLKADLNLWKQNCLNGNAAQQQQYLGMPVNLFGVHELTEQERNVIDRIELSSRQQDGSQARHNQSQTQYYFGEAMTGSVSLAQQQIQASLEMAKKINLQLAHQNSLLKSECYQLERTSVKLQKQIQSIGSNQSNSTSIDEQLLADVIDLESEVAVQKDNVKKLMQFIMNFAEENRIKKSFVLEKLNSFRQKNRVK